MPKFIKQELGKKYSLRFDKQRILTVKRGPFQQRQFQDKVWLVVFTLLILTFAAFTTYFLVTGGNHLKEIHFFNRDNVQKSSIGRTIINSAGLVIGCVFLSVVFSILFLVLCSKYPKCVMYSAIIFTFITYIGLIILGIWMQIYALTIVLFTVFLFNVCVLYCWRHQISVGIVMIKLASNLIAQKPKIIWIGVVFLLINILLMAIFTAGWVSSYQMSLPQNNQDQSSRHTFEIMLQVYLALMVFLSFFFYYVMVFVISKFVKYNYLKQNLQIPSLIIAILRNAGSMTFASFLTTLVSIIRRASQQTNQQNGIFAIFFCILGWITTCLQGFIQVLNHNSVIIMAITGQSYIDSAKSTIGLIYSNFGLFIVVDFITDSIQFYGLMVSSLVPGMIGGGVIYYQQGEIGCSVACGAFILFSSWLLTSITLGVLYEVLSSIFAMYCLDKKLKSHAIYVGDMPQQVIQMLEDISSGKNVDQKNDHNQKGTEAQMNCLSPDILINHPSPYYTNEYVNGRRRSNQYYGHFNQPAPQKQFNQPGYGQYAVAYSSTRNIDKG